MPKSPNSKPTPTLAQRQAAARKLAAMPSEKRAKVVAELARRKKLDRA